MKEKTKEQEILPVSSQKEIMSFREARIYLDVSESLLYKMTSEKAITYYKPRGGKIYFKREDLIAWILQGKSTSISEQENEVINYLKKKNYVRRN